MTETIIHRQDPGRLPVKALAGFMVSLVLMTGLSAFLLARKLVPWPFHGADSLAETYGRIVVYLPVTGFALLSVLWLKGGRKPLAELIVWNRFSFTFAAGLILSAGYSLNLFLTHDFALKGAAFVLPALLMGFLNAVSEEIVFRLVFFQLLIQLIGSWQRANLMQAMVYGAVHLFIGGPVFFLFAFGYGLLMGWIVKSNESIAPAIICHFIADVGAIGLPLLILA